MDAQVIWRPQEGPQTALISCPVFEVFYGGARGGGKTEGSIGDWLEHSSTYGESAIGVFFRRKFKQLEEVVARTKTLFPRIGAKFNEQKAEWVMPGGGRLKFRYLERDSDAEEYQGHSYTRVYVEEVTNFPSPAPINLLRATLRSASGVPTGMRLTGNPGGPGHHWVKKRYIDPCKGGWQVIQEHFEGLDGETHTLERVFIPSTLKDNQLLAKNDPTYVAKLRQVGSEALVKAWLQGDWDIIDGAFFDCWDETKHVLPASVWLPRIPQWATKFRAMDWGFARPFSVGWYAVSDGKWGLPYGALLRYREWYGSDGRPNVGLRMNADLVARGILARERYFEPRTGVWSQESIEYGACDPSMFVRDGGPSIQETMSEEGCDWFRADNKRIAGWAEVRRRLAGPNGTTPMLYFLDCCPEAIRTIPTLQHDDVNAEDVDTDQEDHAGDEVRYACMSRPSVNEMPSEHDPYHFPKTPAQMTINELVQRNRQRRISREADAA